MLARWLGELLQQRLIGCNGEDGSSSSSSKQCVVCFISRPVVHLHSLRRRVSPICLAGLGVCIVGERTHISAANDEETNYLAIIQSGIRAPFASSTEGAAAGCCIQTLLITARYTGPARSPAISRWADPRSAQIGFSANWNERST